MMPEEDWELVPHKVLAELRDEVHLLKDKLAQPSTRKDVVRSNNELKKAIKQLQNTFKDALSQDNGEDPLSARLDSIERQNEEIAKALVAIADMIEGMGGKIVHDTPREKTMMQPPSQMKNIPPPPVLNRPRVRVMPPPPQLRSQPRGPPMPQSQFPPQPPSRTRTRFPPPSNDLDMPDGMPPPPMPEKKKSFLGKIFKK